MPTPLKLLVALTCVTVVPVSSWRLRYSFPSKCAEFNDSRPGPVNDTLATVLRVPGTDEGDTFEFYLADSSYDSSLQEDLCELSKARGSTVKLIQIRIGDDEAGSGVPPAASVLGDGETPVNQRRADSSPTPPPYFTRDAYVHYEGNYYNPDDYCVLNISSTRVTLKACTPDCSANLSSTFLHTPTPSFSLSRVCIPKCCAVDETLSLTNLTCRKLTRDDPYFFLPYIYLKDPIYYFPEEEGELKRHYQATGFNQAVHWRRGNTWNRTTALSVGSRSILGNLHFYRGRVECGADELVVKTFRYGELGGGGGPRKQLPFRLEATPTHVTPSVLTRSRKWLPITTQFCVDGADHWGVVQQSPPANTDPITQVVVMCKQQHDNLATTTDAITLTPQQHTMEMPGTRWAYGVCTIIAVAVLLLILFIYYSLRASLNLQGRVVQRHVLSLVLGHLACVVGEVASLEQMEMENAFKAVDGGGGGDDKRIGVVCLAIALLRHYATLTTYFWLIIMNTSLLNYFPIPFIRRVSRSKEEARVNKTVALMVFSALAWGLPLLLVSAFVAVDFVYVDPFLRVTVPDYAVETCNVASWSALEYLYVPTGLILGISLASLVLRWCVYCWKGTQLDGASANAEMDRARQDEYFSPPLFKSVLLISVLAWATRLSIWYQTTTADFTLDWLFATLAFIVLLFEPLCLLHLYCLNDHVMERLSWKYPRTIALIKLLRACKLVSKGGGMVGEDLLGSGGPDDTVITEAAEEVLELRRK